MELPPRDGDGYLVDMNDWTPETGRAMAERIGQTPGWQEFRLYRTATAAGPLTVTFALTGLGEVRIDDVTIRKVTLPTPKFTYRRARRKPAERR